MMYATKIKMNKGYDNSYKCIDIDSVYLTGANEEKFYKKAALYDYLKTNPNTIRVKKGVEPYLMPELSANGEKYVRSEPNETEKDNLLGLPRE